MLPMGTIVTICMLIGLLFAPFPANPLQRLPGPIKTAAGLLVLAAGLWNVLWYATQHLTEFWGIAALVSGALMILAALYIIALVKLPNAVQKAMPVVLVLLLLCFLKYATTIYQL